MVQDSMHLRWEKRIMRWMLATSPVLMLLLVAGVSPDVLKDQGAGQAFDAKSAFATTCVTCHGPAGGGNGPASAALNPKPANFSSAVFWEGKTDAELLKAIREGGASVGKSGAMPAWGGLYNDAQAKTLLEYLKTLKK
jgi:mono/diheme cytochrome c family protein